MKRVRAFHPFLFALFPVLFLYSRNMALLPVTDVIHPALCVLAGVIALWLVLAVIVRNIDRAAGAVSVFAVSFFAFGPLCEVARPYFPLALDGMRPVVLPYWIAITAILVAGALWKGNLKPSTTTFLNVTGLALVLTSLGSAALGAIRLNSEVAAHRISPVQSGGSNSGVAGTPPDIYYIILDGFGRSDALEQFVGFSNRDFIQSLEKRGFYVASQSHSNYSQTEQSLASSLNLQFLPDLLDGIDASSSDRAPLDTLIDHNGAAKFLREKGYGYVVITTGFPSVHATTADIHLGGKSAVNLLEATLLGDTPLDLSGGEVTTQYNVRRQALTSAFDNLRHLGPGGARPRFVFAHILAPHPPFVFGPNGEPRRGKGAFGYWDGSDYLASVGTVEDYKKGYRDQVAFVQKQVILAVDAILANSKTRPIILIQGDHGSKVHLDQGSLARTDVRECFRNLSTYLVPAPVRQRLYPSITPVNSFRVIFDTLFGGRLPLLPDKSYYSTYPRPYEYTDVTARIEDPKATETDPRTAAGAPPRRHA